MNVYFPNILLLLPYNLQNRNWHLAMTFTLPSVDKVDYYFVILVFVFFGGSFFITNIFSTIYNFFQLTITRIGTQQWHLLYHQSARQISTLSTVGKVDNESLVICLKFDRKYLYFMRIRKRIKKNVVIKLSKNRKFLLGGHHHKGM